MMRAIMAVRNKEIGSLRAAKIFEMPKSALKNKVKSTEQSTEKLVSMRIGRNRVLREDLENALLSYCLIMEKTVFFGFTTKDVKRMPFQPTTTNGISHPFSGIDKKSAWKRFQNFMRRHSELRLRKPQPTAATMAKGFTTENVLKIFDICERLL